MEPRAAMGLHGGYVGNVPLMEKKWENPCILCCYVV